VPGREAFWVAAALFAFGLLRAAFEAHEGLRDVVARLVP
jgi:hypothetical protein